MATIPEMLKTALQHHQAHRWQEAESAYRAILQIDPHQADALHLLGLIRHETGRPSEAIDYMTMALQAKPNFPEAHFNLGIAYQKQGKPDAAASSYREALRYKPDYAEAHFNLGNLLKDQDRLADAEVSFREAVRWQPKYVKAYNNLGTVLQDQGKVDEAVVIFQEALRIKSDYASAYTNLGGALRQQGKLDEAIACCEKSLRLDRANPEAHNNLGAALLDQGKVEESLVRFQEALRLKPDYAKAQNNLAAAYQDLGNFDAALAAFERTARLEPNYGDAHTNKAMLLLLRGDFAQGWREYEWRFRRKEAQPRQFRQPRWDGAPLAGRTILLHAEQGLGDTLHFIRYAPLVKERGGRVIVECQKALLRLLAGCKGIDELVAAGAPLPEFDVYAPLLSLPGIFGTDLQNVPSDVPYLAADAELIARWRDALTAIPGIKIGIAWQGNPHHKKDRQRSVPLAQFAPLASVPGVRLLSLQKGHGVEQLRDVADRFAVIDLGSRLDETSGAFMDTAAVMRNLDLVITSDTATAHLAGALGVPVWVALSHIPDWRWLLERTDSPWYPNMWLFRQKQRGDWADVFARMAQALQERSRSMSSTPGIRVEIAPGELIDKITILEIKSARITDAGKLHNVRVELDVLNAARDGSIKASPDMNQLTAELKAVNEKLWDIEDEIRDCERQANFSPRFIELARAVYKTNDVRAALKRRINELLGSTIVEEKSYAKYQ